MSFNINTENKNNFSNKTQLIKLESIKSIDNYNQFINWISSEFDLYLQEKTTFLTVYFPNGYFNIKIADYNNLTLAIEVNAKTSILCKKIMTKIETLYNRMLFCKVS
ncbi:hypothetical protein [Polaribacter sargassicola]|uniref:hypothetical protein n=1 Tax=Polaribacter sargassicola TaxID=2836891 RepID=UPI001F4118BC|nr:hypothetical protein [Polaribacter sp. DS7-9]MCG1037150.1 hypothetical protein [Polaribacter sp. DS7-9]